MLLSTFLNIFGACTGFMASVLFAVGAIGMTPLKIFKVAATYWDANQHWADSIADQRADYITGGLLLLLSFSLQIAANIVPSDVQPLALQHYGSAGVGIVVSIVVLLVATLLFRNYVAKSTRQKVHQMQDADLAAQELAVKTPVV